jgi:hypothetical protein
VICGTRAYPGDTEGRIVWREAAGAEHERLIADEATALLALEWVAGHPHMQLVSFARPSE